MTGLLVSVRSADEARAALDGGADLIDVKEPTRGSLGAADHRVWCDVVSAVAGRAPCSVALGELSSIHEEIIASNLTGYSFVKVGLAGCANAPDWARQWRLLFDIMPDTVTPVAVVYADWQSAAAPDPFEILSAGSEAGCRAMLVDTYDKSRGGLFDVIPVPKLCALINEARCSGLRVVLAGSLSFETLPTALQLHPDFVAVRTAVCRPTRNGAVQQSLVRQLANVLAAHARRTSA